MRDHLDPVPRPIVLITGGNGFVGHALVHELTRPESEAPVISPREIRIFDTRGGEHAPDDRIRQIHGDLRDLDALRAACAGVDLVFHLASIVDWGRQPDELLEAVNVGGVENVVRACREAGVPCLVHTSTLDVVYTGERVIDGDESMPYPSEPYNGYCGTKARGEQAALRAHGQPLVGREGSLSVLALRPLSIFGERDPYHVPPLMKMARAGWVIRVGDGTSKSQHCYVGNVAHAQCVAGRALLEGRGGGEPYFITDFAPRNFFDYLEPILNACGYRMVPWRLALPRAPMMALATVLEGSARLLRPIVRFVPTLTRFAVNYLCLDFTLRGEKLAGLGYAPRYTEEQAFERTIAWFKDQRAPRHEAGPRPAKPATAPTEAAPTP